MCFSHVIAHFPEEVDIKNIDPGMGNSHMPFHVGFEWSSE